MSPVVVISLKDKSQRAEIAGQIANECSAQVISVGSLYHLPDQDDLWTLLHKPFETMVIVSDINPRPIECLLRERGVIIENLTCIDSRVFDNQIDLVNNIMDLLPDNVGSGELVNIDTDLADRWYPVIDRSLCVACGHCVQFCLFGVYSSSDGVAVVQPDCCKPGCPACSRVCPQGAIIFPLYDKDPAIAGVPGRIITPDPAARAMYYKRTGAVCPVCSKQAAIDALAGTKCPECGREIPVQADSQTDDELDRLIDEFDKLKFGG